MKFERKRKIMWNGFKKEMEIRRLQRDTSYLKYLDNYKTFRFIVNNKKEIF